MKRPKRKPVKKPLMLCGEVVTKDEFDSFMKTGVVTERILKLHREPPKPTWDDMQ